MSGRVFHILISTITGVMLACSSVGAQSLDDRLDEERYLKGLSELQLPEVLEHYIAAFPSGDAVRAMQYRISAERMVMLQQGLPAAEKLRYLENILDARRQMIERFERDPRRIGWMLDQASDLLFELLPIEAAGLTTLYGSPSPSQRQRAERVAREIHALAMAAETAVSQAILNLEAEADYAGNVLKQSMRRDLAERDRDRRIPFFRGIGVYLYAALVETDEASREQHWRLSRDLLEPLTTQLDGALASQAKLYAGLAMARLGLFDAADDLFRTVATSEGSPPADVFAARMGGVLNRLESSGEEAALRGLASIEDNYARPEEMFFRVLIADQRFLLAQQRAMQQPAGPARDAALAVAFNAYIDLLEADAGVDPDVMQAIVLGKLSNVADEDAPLDRLPALVTIARADAVARDDAQRGQAIALYERVIDRADLPETQRALALFGLGRTYAQHQQPLSAAETFMRIARDIPRDRRAEQSMVLAASIAADTYQRDQESREARQTLDEALRLLLDRYSNLPDVDRWRYLAGRTAMQDGRLEEAISRFESCSAGSAQLLDARFMAVRCARALAEASGENVQAAQLHERTLNAIAAARPQLEAGVRAATSASRRDALLYYLDYLAVFEAESQVDMGAASRAISVLDAMRPMEELDPAILADALRLRINALQSLGQAGDAMDEVQQLLRTSPEQVDDVIVPMLAGMERDVRELLEQGRDSEATTKASGDLMTLSRILEQWISERGESMGERVSLYHAIARANELAGRFAEALTIYERLLSYQPDGGALLRGKAECLYQLGGNDGLAESIRIFRRLASAGESIGRDIYWLAQLRSVQILDKVGRNTNQIVPHIQRLEREDPNLGGPRYRQQFNQLLAKYQ